MWTPVLCFFRVSPATCVSTRTCTVTVTRVITGVLVSPCSEGTPVTAPPAPPASTASMTRRTSASPHPARGAVPASTESVSTGHVCSAKLKGNISLQKIYLRVSAYWTGARSIFLLNHLTAVPDYLCLYLFVLAHLYQLSSILMIKCDPNRHDFNIIDFHFVIYE